MRNSGRLLLATAAGFLATLGALQSGTQPGTRTSALPPMQIPATLGPCTAATFFTASPLDVADILSIRPLGNLNPPGHVFPTDHIYFYITRNPAGGTNVVPLYAPGTMTVTSVVASQHVTAGFTDFALELSPCEGVTVSLGHIVTLDPGIFGDSSAFAGWDLVSEYSTGGETFRMWRRTTRIAVNGGQVLGTVGGNPGQWALDVGLYDERVEAPSVANPLRWTKSRAPHAVCPLDAYGAGPLRDTLLALVERDGGIADADRCGVVFQDVPGTAQGCWFLPGASAPYPEDPHLALVASSIHPAEQVLSVGTSVRGLVSRGYAFLPADTGRLNRAFSEIRPDSQIYGYRVDGFVGTIIVAMPDAQTLWIEALPGATASPTRWAFTSGKTIFIR